MTTVHYVPSMSGENNFPQMEEKALCEQLVNKVIKAPVHQELVKSDFQASIRKKEISKTTYTLYLADLLAIYEPLEDQLTSHQNDPLLKNLFIPNLFRYQALLKDLKTFKGSREMAGKAARAYGEHLKDIGLNKPYLLIAHAWSRYLDDVFIGQMICKKLSPQWGKDGMSLYKFDDLLAEYQLSDPTDFVVVLKGILNDIKLTPKQVGEIIEEAKNSFERHLKIYDELKHPETSRSTHALALTVLNKSETL